VTGTVLVAAWEAASLGRSVSHLEHVEIAWELVRRHGAQEAERRLVEGTRRNCDAAGAPDRFDEGLTRRWAGAVAAAQERTPAGDFAAFLAAHPELGRGDLLGRPAWHGTAGTLTTMFTGIVRERGRVAALDGGHEGMRLLVEAPATAAGVRAGDSVSVNGTCLTATEVADGAIAFQAVPETLRRTSLGRLAPGAAVNVEPALRAGEPLGGHYVQGHVDAVGRVRSVAAEGEGTRVWIDAPQEVLRYCVEKGSVAVEGVSLTVAELDGAGLAVALVPHTLAATTLGGLQAGDEVNLEADVLAKYVERLLPR
jgi:riboflavin synthase